MMSWKGKYKRPKEKEYYSLSKLNLCTIHHISKGTFDYPESLCLSNNLGL